MTEPTEVGSIVGYLILNRSDWTAGVGATKRDADQLGRLSPNIRIQTNTGEVLGQLALVQAAERKVGSEADSASKHVGGPGIGLVGALLSVAPAAVPIGAVAGGALAGLIPVAATVALGIAGIKDELKAGSLAGTQYGHDMDVLGNEAERLKNIAAGGLLTGIDKGLASAHGLLPEVNRDVAVMAGQIGNIIGDSGPGLLALLHGLSPLFATFGNEVESGAQHFEHWVTSSDDVQQFVAYVQAEMPEVVQFLGQLLTVVGHLTQASEGAGSGLVFGFTEVARAINSIPIGVLEVLIPLAISAKAAMLGYAAVTAVANGVSTAWTAMGGVVAGVSEGVIASEVASQAVVDEAEAAKAAAALASARARMALVAGVSESLAAEAEADVASAEAIAEAEAAKAAETRAAATAMAESNVAAGASMSAVLGPIGAVVVGGALLATMFMHSGTSAQDSANEINNFASALEQSKGAIDANVRSTVAKSLADRGVLDIATAQGISLRDVTSATLGNAAASDRVQASINAQAKAWTDLYSKGQLTHGQWEKMQAQLVDLAQGINHTSGQFGQASQRQKELAATAEQATTALGRQQAAVGWLVTAHGNLQLAEEKSGQKLADGTQAMQAQTRASTLLKNALDVLNGVNLSVEQTTDSYNLGLAQLRNHTGLATDANGHFVTSLSQTSAAGIQNRQMLTSLIQQAKDHAAAIADEVTKKKGETAGLIAGNQALREDEQRLRNAATAAGLNKTAVDHLINSIGKLSHVRADPTININTDAAYRELANLQAAIDALGGSSPNVAAALGHAKHNTLIGQAEGGTVGGPRTPYGDKVLTALAPGEEVISNSHGQADRNRALLKAINAGGLAGGGTVGSSSAAVTIAEAIYRATSPAPTTVAGQRADLAQHIGGATTRQAAATAGLAAYRQLAAELKEVTKATDAQVAAAKHESVQAIIAANKAQNYAQSLPSATKAEKAAKAAAEDHAKALQHEADVAGNVATKTENAAQRKQKAAQNAADKSKKAYEQEARAAKAAAQVVEEEAQAIVSSYADQVTSMLASISDFESGISSGISMGSDLATAWGQITDGVTQTQSTLDSAKQTLAGATVDTSALADAQAAEAQATRDQAAAHDELTKALASGDPAAILAAQNAQTDASTRLAAAQAAVTAATPTPDQLKAQAAAQQQVNDAQLAYGQAVAAQSGTGLQGKFDQVLASAQHFVGDLNSLAADGANQSFIEQIAGMGPQAGDALAQAILAAGPNGLSQLQDTMGQISTLAGSEGASLADGFFGTGVDSITKLGDGMLKQFPELASALAPYLAQLKQSFVFQATITGPDGNPVGAGSASSGGKGTSAAATAHYYLAHDPKTGTWWDVTDSGSVHLLTAAQLAADMAAGADVRNVNGRPKPMQGFASGTLDAPGGAALVGEMGAELVLGPQVMNLPRHSGVIPLNRVKDSAFDNSAVVTELRALRSQVATLAGDIGEVQARVGAGLYATAGRTQADRMRRAVRTGAY